MGQVLGGVTNLSTKSGTNSLHGEAYEYVRNKIFNANDFFLNAVEIQAALGAKPVRSKCRRPVNFSRNGGRNKTFWFFSWESFRLRTGQPFTTTVPDAKERIGDFSEILQVSSLAVSVTIAKPT